MTDVTSPHQLPERERNRRLRRVDWRFLLSTPLPERILCLGDADLRAGCESMGTCTDAAVDETRTEYDLVVVQNADADALQKAWARLRAGGELYGEWTDRGTGAVHDALAAAEFRDVRCYWPWPPPPDAEVWVPLEAPWAFDYFVHVDRHVYAGLRHRLGTRARRTVARRRLASGRTKPLCVVARKAAEDPDDSGVPPVLARLRTYGTGRPPTERLTCALLSGGPRALSKVVGVVYAPGDRSPACVVKWPRVDDAEAGLANEAMVLEACHRDGDVIGVPRVLAATGSGARLAVAETVVEGAPMFMRLTAANFDGLARSGAAWLADFHTGRRGPVADAAALRTRVNGAVARFAETFSDVIERTLLDDTIGLLRGLRGVPTVIEHRDYGPWNIFTTDAGQLGVLDWESSRIDGLPLLDLIYFVTYMAFFLDGAMVSREFVHPYRRSLDPRTVTGAVRQTHTASYCEHFAITADAERALRALCWMEHAESEFRAFSADAAGRPPTALLRTSVFARLWAEEIAFLCR